jgi:hypothetical protein
VRMRAKRASSREPSGIPLAHAKAFPEAPSQLSISVG